jgi:hypothetical protein
VDFGGYSVVWQLLDEQRNVNAIISQEHGVRFSRELLTVRLQLQFRGGAKEMAEAIKLMNDLMGGPTTAARVLVEAGCPELARYKQLRLDMLAALEGKAKAQAHAERRLAELKSEERDADDAIEDRGTSLLSAIARARVEVGAELHQADMVIEMLRQPLTEARAAAVRALYNAAADAWTSARDLVTVRRDSILFKIADQVKDWLAELTALTAVTDAIALNGQLELATRSLDYLVEPLPQVQPAIALAPTPAQQFNREPKPSSGEEEQYAETFADPPSASQGQRVLS